MPHDEHYEVNLGNINGGKVLESAQDALAKIIANIRDPNTPAEQKRKMVLTIEFKPNRQRDHADIVAKVETKLAGNESTQGSVFISGQNGRLRGYVRDIAQDELFTRNEPAAGSERPS